MRTANNQYRDPEKYLTAIVVTSTPAGNNNGQFLKYRGIHNATPAIDSFEKFVQRTFPTVTAINYYKKGNFLRQKKFLNGSV